MEQKFDFKDITLIPETISTISHRSWVNVYNDYACLPIMVSPMDTVVNEENYQLFLNQSFEVCVPRGVMTKNNLVFTSMSLDDFEDYVTWYSVRNDTSEQIRILIDIANGHMIRLYDIVKKFYSIRKSDNHKIMVGNIANPKTYSEFAKIGVDYVRVGIGGGSGCLTSANTGVHYPMASLIHEIYNIKKENSFNTKIVADGGFKNYDDIIKALALGADYVMLGGILNKCLESCSETKLFKKISISDNTASYLWKYYPKLRKYFYKSFRGMSTKEVQRKWNKNILKTSEGISKINKVEYTLEQWSKNFEDYLRSAMSYTNSMNLDEFKESEFIFITENALNRFNK
jgi:IMP dehydrogenase/GMP reductase